MITVLAGGVGAARYLVGQQQASGPDGLTAVVNVADDGVVYGLDVSPDLDTVVYTLATKIDPQRGWGRADETWTALEELRGLGYDAWFNLGDRDIATHLLRTSLLRQGVPLSAVTARLAEAFGIGCRVLPLSDDRIATRVMLASGEEVDFQEYFVKLRHDVAISGVRFVGVTAARPAPGVIDAISEADVVVIAPSNPVVSIAPILAVAEVSEAMVARRERNVAVSPIVAGAALRGPAGRMLAELGEGADVVAVARRYRDFVATLVIDSVDAAYAGAVAACGVRPVLAHTIMSSPAVAAELARRTVAAVTEPSR